MQPSYRQKVIFYAASVRDFKFLNFCHVSVAWIMDDVKICVCIPNFVKFVRFAADMEI